MLVPAMQRAMHCPTPGAQAGFEVLVAISLLYDRREMPIAISRKVLISVGVLKLWIVANREFVSIISLPSA